MADPTPDAARKSIDSLTKNLLECYEELDLIYRLSRGLMTNLDAGKSAALILREALDIFEAGTGWVVPTESSAAFEEVMENADPEMVRRLGSGPFRDVITAGRSRVFYSPATELGMTGAAVPESLLCSVLRTETAVYGLLCVGRNGAGSLFTAGDLKLADVLASQAAVAIENSVLQRRRFEEEQAMIRIQEELRLARDIQQNLLPSAVPAHPGYEIAAYAEPARSVGGDYYDFIAVEEGRSAVCLADITGKGMPAALLMANLQATIRGQTLLAAGPAECLRRSNTLLYRSTRTDRFATCVYGVLDTSAHRFVYSNAGHDHPILFRNGGHERLAAGGLVLGVREESGYEEAAVDLEPGDLLVLYSDGITEVFDPDGGEFGEAGLVNEACRRRGESADSVLAGILDAARAHGQGQAQGDDMTLIVIRRVK